MSHVLEADLCVIGAGSGGLSVAAGAAQMGARVVLIERNRMGGDCLNTGCVPSKALIAAAHAADAMRRSGRFGINGHEPDVDFLRVRGHVRDVIAGIAPHDSAERFEGLGVTVLRASAHFAGPNEIKAGTARVRARRFVVATGSSPFMPPIPGLGDSSALTNETVFDLDSRPEHLIVIGGGPIGVEMAQAHRRLGASVTILQRGCILPKDDPDAVAVVRRRLMAEGVTICEGAKVVHASRRGNGVVVTAEINGAPAEIAGSHLLVAVGRRADVDGLGLDAAGIAHSQKGITVDARLRTSNRRVFAIGDVTGEYQFTHMAAYQAGIVIRNALFHWPAKVDTRAFPWVTYTDPELAHVGLTAAMAEEQGHSVRLAGFNLAENDRARAERETEGFVKIVVGRRSKVLGATVVGRGAGELILPWVLAISQGLGIGAMARVIAPYPTLSEISKGAASAYYAPTLFGPTTRKIVRLLQRFS
ncbi:FAD-dependent oxidoreductase [Microvirga aerilata]|uniref:FAD-dependent oxidoreductase n=1 Tax=Microvirga aerilata TaxID=670292 RepID=A0A936ZCX7_9HYPH|nr:FAD-dependent oxidoreductase [Microvirga aerilata]MBL0407902.1 FAD-dependent oxidoreductase [Microvirga aerilata]